MNVYSTPSASFVLLWNVSTVCSFIIVIKELIRYWKQTGNPIRSFCGTICPITLFLISVFVVIGLTYRYIPPPVTTLLFWLLLKTQKPPQDVQMDNWNLESIESARQNRKKLVETSLITRKLLAIKEKADNDPSGNIAIDKLRLAIANRSERFISMIFPDIIVESNNKIYYYSDRLPPIYLDFTKQETSVPTPDDEDSSNSQASSAASSEGQNRDTDLDPQDGYNSLAHDEVCSGDDHSTETEESKTEDSKIEDSKTEDSRIEDSKTQEVCSYADDNFNMDEEICSICLGEFKVGEHICWSQNKNCHHAFHYECIHGWVMEKSECPVCRRDYLKIFESNETDIELGSSGYRSSDIQS
uniref:RING-type E3 ubiquitin transferase n=1 Tax=Corethron hystrix TaxID=216773 RepID=A0A7S1B7E2_9STRA|mmetsp:Transcript_14321/g.31345  ORF Transcript_14321/g.31345 Transcript_14321/m.31345 type:complete len:357 (+) Transcript_14321:261-1331(+)